MSADALYSKLSAAKTYLAKIGRRDQCDGHFGKLNVVKVSTDIAHQEYAGAKNYHDNADFDAALSIAVREEFGTLSARAIQIMETAANAALIQEEDALRKRLKRIEELKEGTIK